MLINLNMNLLTHITFTIKINKSGGIKPKVSINTISIYPYNMSFLYFLAEVAWLLVYLRLSYSIYIMFKEIYTKPTLRALTECDEEYKDRDFFTRIMNYPIEKVENFKDALFRVLSYFWKHVQRVWSTIKFFMGIKTLYFF